MTAPSHQALYRSAPLILGGLLAALALAIAGGAIGLSIVARDQRLALVLGLLGLFVLVFFACALTALRRHRWTIEAGGDANGVLIDERPLVPLFGRRRVRRVPFDRIAALSNAPNGADEVLALTTRDGERFVLPPRRDRTPDQEGLSAFARQLQAAMAAAGRVAPPVTDGLGFWNRPPGRALLAITLAVSLAVAAVVLWGVWQGAASRVKTNDAAAFLVALPIGVAWLLRRAWQRRRAVMKAMR
jgi:hypothetical protein